VENFAVFSVFRISGSGSLVKLIIEPSSNEGFIERHFRSMPRESCPLGRLKDRCGDSERICLDVATLEALEELFLAVALSESDGSCCMLRWGGSRPTPTLLFFLS